MRRGRGDRRGEEREPQNRGEGEERGAETWEGESREIGGSCTDLKRLQRDNNAENKSKHTLKKETFLPKSFICNSI
jgi:hypothetical protein